MRDAGTAVDEQAPHASLPEVRIDEEGIEFGIPIRARQDCSESDDHTGQFGHEHVTIGDLFERKDNRIPI